MKLLDLIIDKMEDLKAEDIKVYDFKNTSPICDAFVVCEAQSSRQVKAIADAVEKAVLEAGYKIKQQGKAGEESWVIIDAIDVVAHVFSSEERAHYDIDKLYKEFIRG
ncbi:MAG: ribosome silencing factor [Erysipelothrix sp.]|nr:ribosome silencing factor [Erysipelothrix sp.]